MERKLFIIRHGKSSWDHEDLDDIDRPLNNRGIRSAKIMANRLMEKDLIPELIYTSPARRAHDTAMIMHRIWGMDPSVLQTRDVLYMAYLREISAVVGETPAEIRSLAIFGHNPSFTLYANTFLDVSLDNLPTAGVVLLTLDSDSWKDIGRKQVISTLVDYPKKEA